MPDRGLLPFQRKALEIVVKGIVAGTSRMLIEMATGTGKTRLAAEIAAEANRLIQQREGRRLSALFLVDRDTLEEQAIARLEHDLHDLKVGEVARHGLARIDLLVAQVATMQHRYMSEPFHPTYFDLIIVDEAHRSVHGDSWRKVVEYFECIQVGLTATPPRLGDDETINYFGLPVFQFGYEDAVRQGYLAPFVIHRVKTDIDKNGLNLDGTLFQSQDFGVSVAVENRDRRIAEYYLDHFYGRKCLLFAASTAHAESLWRAFNEEFAKREDEFSAKLVLSSVDSAAARAEIISEFQAPDSSVRVLINLNILTAGFDFPELDLLFMCRYTRHKSLYLQMKGRGARIPRDRFGQPIVGVEGQSSKDRFVIADFVGVTDWERQDMVAAPTIAPEEADQAQPLADEVLRRLREPADILSTDVPVQIAEVEIISPFELGEEVSAPTMRAEVAELRSELNLYQQRFGEEGARLNGLVQRISELEEAGLAERRNSFRQLIQVLARTLPPLLKLDEDLLGRAAPDAFELAALNEAFQCELPSIGAHIERVLAEPVRARYRDLVDQKYTRGLNGSEQLELSQLDTSLDGIDASYYGPIIDALRGRLDASEKF